MNRTRLSLSLIIIFAVSALVFFLHSNKNCQVGDGEAHSADTLYLTKTDTLLIKDTVYITKRVVDTLYITTPNDETISLPIVQKHFGKPNLYDVWISGVEPLSLDSGKVYAKTEYKTITNYVDKAVYKEQYRLYVGGGLFSFRESFTPYVSISLSTPKKWLISSNFGLNGYFGVSVKYSIFSYEGK